MPYKSEKIKLNELQDRRKKLTDVQRQEIEKLYGTGSHSLNSLAKKFDVSKKTILLIVNKDSAEKSKQYRKEHWKEWEKKGEERNKAVRNYRHYKQELYKNGKLTDSNN
ncbi:MAG: hypothetical protein PUC23_03445 [bacterium]|nr:hypothetical protein [bacterium]